MCAMRGWIAVTVVLALTGGLLAACGTRSHPATITVPHATDTIGAPAAVTAGAPANARRPLTKAQASAFARAVNLRAGDLLGFRASSGHEQETAADKLLERKMLHCTRGVGLSNGLAEASSKDFEREATASPQSVSSNVAVVQTPALAAKELAAIRTNHVRACLSHYFDLFFSTHSSRLAAIGPVSISQGSPPAPGTTGSFGWRITATLTLNGSVGLPVYLDILGFVDGPAQVALVTSGLSEPFPAATEQRLFALLVERARAHSA
jgi:hypothetical protein